MSLALKSARGDPGIFGTFGSILSGITGVASKIPGPIGWGASAVKAVLPSRSGARPAPVAPYRPSGSGSMVAMPGTGFPQAPTPGIRGVAQRLVPGGQTGYQPQAPTAEIGSPSGYHVNKSSYFLKDGTFIEEGTRWVKNRKRNPLNPRAASKAIGRIESLKKATKRFSHIIVKKKDCCK